MSNVFDLRSHIELFCHPPSVSGTPLANGKMHFHSSVKRKLAEEKGYVFDKRLRYNVRQNESNCRFRDIVVRKEEGFTHVLLSSQTTDNNALTPEVRMRMYTLFHTLIFLRACPLFPRVSLVLLMYQDHLIMYIFDCIPVNMELCLGEDKWEKFPH